MNLAAAFSLLGKKTVILEFDLRKPKISEALGITAKDGISSILAGKASVHEIIKPIPNFENNLYLLPAGYLAPNPAELISSSRMVDLIELLRKDFDQILIDTPPFSLVTDATLLQTYADISIVVLRQDHTNKEVYSELTKMKNEASNNLYLVLK